MRHPLVIHEQGIPFPVRKNLLLDMVHRRLPSHICKYLFQHKKSPNSLKKGNWGSYFNKT